MKIANICYEENLVNHKKLDFINYINSELSSTEHDFLLPTLFVGWEYTKKNIRKYPISILDKEILKNKYYWEFSFSEDKNKHIKGIPKFIEKVFDYRFANYKYEDIDPIFKSFKTEKEILDYVSKINCGYGYQLGNESIYMVCGFNIYGLNLKLLKYIGMDVEKIQSALKERIGKYIYDNGELYDMYQTQFPEYKILERYIPLMARI